MSFLWLTLWSVLVIWVDDFAPELGGFAARCEYIQPGFTDLRSRLVDIGFLGL